MASSKVGTKGFKSRADIEAYVAAFNADDFETYFQYYHPEVCIDIGAIPGEKTIKGYHEWVVGHHQIASETLVPQKLILDSEKGMAVLDSLTEFRGRQGKDRDDFFGWGPISEGKGPVVRMIVFYHLDDAGRIKHLEPAGATLVKRADSHSSASDGTIKEKQLGFFTKEHVRDYLRHFSTNQSVEASAFWAPNIKVTIGPTVIHGREENIKFFTAQRASNVNENVEPTVITLDESGCALRAVVTFTALRGFPEGFYGMGAQEGVKIGQKIRNDYIVFYDLDENRMVAQITAHQLGIPKFF